MVEEKTELDEMSREIRKIISENKKFLDRIMDEEFEPDEESEEEAGTVVEL
ncbi:MAG: hypothetical protein ABSG48_02095 [Geobacteraceae bacterium]|jgi:hypothetical protein